MLVMLAFGAYDAAQPRASFSLTLQRRLLMPDPKTRSLKPSVLIADRQSFAALKTITGYAPANPDFSVASATAALADLDSKLELVAQAEAALKTARDEAVASAWVFHDKMVGAKDSVSAQFGKNSNEVQAVGRKKQSEYKKSTRKPNQPGAK
jgi:hypothetical protein